MYKNMENFKIFLDFKNLSGIIPKFLKILIAPL
jgi:hypothetical protein